MSCFNPPCIRRRVTVLVCVCMCVCVCVCMCVCVRVSVKSHLISGASFRPENSVTYSAGNGDQKFVGFSLKPHHCRNPALPPLKAIHIVGHFPTERVHAHYSIYHVVSHEAAFRELPLAGLSTMA